jgi:hypothetical protein
MMSYLVADCIKTFSTPLETITVIMLDHWIHILTFIWIVCCIYLITIKSVNRNDRRTSYFLQNEILRVKIDKISVTNAEISDQISALNELYTFLIICSRLRRYLAQYILQSIVNKS